MSSFVTKADQYSAIRDHCDYVWQDGQQILERAHRAPLSVDDTHMMPYVMNYFIAELLVWLEQFCFYEPLTTIGSDSTTCCVWNEWYKKDSEDGSYIWASWTETEQYVQQENRFATEFNTSHMTLRGFWGASFSRGKFRYYIEECLDEKPETTTFVLLVAGNDVDGETAPEEITSEMNKLKVFCRERGVRLIYIDVVPAWSQQ